LIAYDLYAVIAKNVAELDKLLEKMSIDEILDNYITFHGVVHVLQIIIQALIDLGQYVISIKGQKPPSTYSEIPLILKDLEVITKSEASQFRKMIGFRNIIVHRYTDLNLTIIEKILANKLYKNALEISKKLVIASKTNSKTT